MHDIGLQKSVNRIDTFLSYCSDYPERKQRHFKVFDDRWELGNFDWHHTQYCLTSPQEYPYYQSVKLPFNH